MERGDVKLKNMLSVLNDVGSDDDNDEDVDKEVLEIFSRSKKERKRRKKRSKNDLAKKSDDDSTKPSITENVETDESDEEDIFDVRCKTTIGKFHLTKFQSGGAGKCILYDDEWFTPNEFERNCGSRAKKYKVSLFVNNKPIIKLLESRNVNTPSRSGSRSGRTTPLSGRSTPLSGKSTPAKEATDTKRAFPDSPQRTPKSTRKGKRRKLINEEPIVEEVNEVEDVKKEETIVTVEDDSTPAVSKTPKSTRKGRRRKVLDQEPIVEEVNEVEEIKENEENDSTPAPTPGRVVVGILMGKDDCHYFVKLSLSLNL